MNMTMESAYLTRLRVAGPMPNSVEINDTRRALREGREILRKENNDRPKLREVIWRLLQDAATTEARIVDSDKRFLDTSLENSFWRNVHDLNEQLKVQWEIGIEEAQGLRAKPREGEFKPRLAITDPTAIRRMLTVMGWLKSCKFKSIHRRKFNTSILMLRARGVTALTVSRMLRGRIGERGIEMARSRLLDQIERHVSVLDNA